MSVALPYLITKIEVSGLLGPLDSEVKARLRVEGAGIEWRDDPRLRPRPAEGIGSESDDICFRRSEDPCLGKRLRQPVSHTVWPISRLMAHQSIVALVRLNDVWRLKVVLVEAVDHFL